MKFKKTWLCLVGVAFILSSAVFAAHDVSRSLVHILSYLSQDYAGAVKDGKVINQTEYTEQIEFINEAIRIENQEPLLKKSLVKKNLEKLKSLILSKAQAEKVSSLAIETKSKIIAITKLQITPARWPDISHGKKLFAQNCVTCHGEKGDGQGPAAGLYDPKPANFLDSERMQMVSPFQVFNTVRLGIAGTAMSAFPQLNDDETWALAFYISSLRHKNSPASHFDVKKLGLEKIATLSDQELGESPTALATIRNYKDDGGGPGAALELAKSELNQSLSEYKANNFDVARSKALSAYLEGVEPVEPRLRASDPNLTIKLEEQMSLVRGLIESRSSEKELSENIQNAVSTLESAQQLLAEKKSSPEVSFFVASAIILREGFEAVLIIIALLGVIRASGQKRAAYWVHGGWISALILGLIAWFVSGILMAISGAQREVLEGGISLFAVVILLYMGFWLHNKTEIYRWKSFIDGQVKQALAKSNLLALALISFMGVFREAFETVLFLRALWLEASEASRTAIFAGVAGSFVAIFFMAWLLIRYTSRLPIKKLFEYSSLLMCFLAVILAGKGVHALQEVAFISITPLNIFRVETLGVFPTIESISTQLGILMISIMLWFLGKKSTTDISAASADATGA